MDPADGGSDSGGLGGSGDGSSSGVSVDRGPTENGHGSTENGYRPTVNGRPTENGHPVTPLEELQTTTKRNASTVDFWNRTHEHRQQHYDQNHATPPTGTSKKALKRNLNPTLDRMVEGGGAGNNGIGVPRNQGGEQRGQPEEEKYRDEVAVAAAGEERGQEADQKQGGRTRQERPASPSESIGEARSRAGSVLGRERRRSVSFEAGQLGLTFEIKRASSNNPSKSLHAVVTETTPGMAAAELGVAVGDRMVAVNGHPIDLGDGDAVNVHKAIDLSQRPLVIDFARTDTPPSSTPLPTRSSKKPKRSKPTAAETPATAVPATPTVSIQLTPALNQTGRPLSPKLPPRPPAPVAISSSATSSQQFSRPVSPSATVPSTPVTKTTKVVNARPLQAAARDGDGREAAAEGAYKQAMVQGASGGSTVTRVITRHAYDDFSAISDRRAISPTARLNVKRIVTRERQNQSGSQIGDGNGGGSMSRHHHRLGVAQNKLTTHQTKMLLDNKLTPRGGAAVGGGMVGRASRSARTSPARNRGSNGSNGVGFGRGGGSGRAEGRQKKFLKAGSGPVSQRTLGSSRSVSPSASASRMRATSPTTASDLKQRLRDRQSPRGASEGQQNDAMKREGGLERTRGRVDEDLRLAETDDRKPDEGGVDEVVWGTRDLSYTPPSQWAALKEGDILLRHPVPSHSVSFAMHLDSLALADFSDAKRNELTSDLARSLGVNREQIKILNVRAGSVVVDAAVVGLQNMEQAGSAARAIREKADLGTLCDYAEFGSCTVMNVQCRAEPVIEDGDKRNSSSKKTPDREAPEGGDASPEREMQVQAPAQAQAQTNADAWQRVLELERELEMARMKAQETSASQSPRGASPDSVNGGAGSVYGGAGSVHAAGSVYGSVYGSANGSVNGYVSDDGAASVSSHGGASAQSFCGESFRSCAEFVDPDAASVQTGPNGSNFHADLERHTHNGSSRLQPPSSLAHIRLDLDEHRKRLDLDSPTSAARSGGGGVVSGPTEPGLARSLSRSVSFEGIETSSTNDNRDLTSTDHILVDTDVDADTDTDTDANESNEAKEQLFATSKYAQGATDNMIRHVSAGDVFGSEGSGSPRGSRARADSDSSDTKLSCLQRYCDLFCSLAPDQLRVKVRIVVMVMFALFTMLPACIVLQLYTAVGQYVHHTFFAVLSYWVVFSFLTEGTHLQKPSLASGDQRYFGLLASSRRTSSPARGRKSKRRASFSAIDDDIGLNEGHGKVARPGSAGEDGFGKCCGGLFSSRKRCLLNVAWVLGCAGAVMIEIYARPSLYVSSDEDDNSEFHADPVILRATYLLGEIGFNFMYHVPDDEPHHMWRLWLGTVVSMAIASVFFCFPFGREHISYGRWPLSTWLRCTVVIVNGIALPSIVFVLDASYFKKQTDRLALHWVHDGDRRSSVTSKPMAVDASAIAIGPSRVALTANDQYGGGAVPGEGVQDRDSEQPSRFQCPPLPPQTSAEMQIVVVGGAGVAGEGMEETKSSGGFDGVGGDNSAQSDAESDRSVGSESSEVWCGGGNESAARDEDERPDMERAAVAMIKTRSRGRVNSDDSETMNDDERPGARIRSYPGSGFTDVSDLDELYSRGKAPKHHEFYHRGYATYVVFIMNNLFKCVIIIYAGLRKYKIVCALCLCSFVAVVIDVTHAVCWRGIGDGNAVFVVPAVFFAIELSQSVLFLGTSLNSAEFWVLFVLQKCYTIMRNSGLTTWLGYEIRQLFKKGPSLIEQKRNLERRYLYATADNFAEIVSPVVVILTVVYEMILNKYMSKDPDAGISSSVLYHLQGQVPLRMTIMSFAILIMLRVAFCGFEVWFGDWLEEEAKLTPTFLLSSPTVAGKTQKHGRKKSGGGSSPRSNTPSRLRRGSGSFRRRLSQASKSMMEELERKMGKTDFSRDSRYSLAMKNMIETMAGNEVPLMQMALMVILVLAQISNMIAESAHYVGTPTT